MTTTPPTHHPQVPKDALNITTQALTIRFDVIKQKIIHLPLDEVNVAMRSPAVRNAQNYASLFPTEKIWGTTDRTGTLSMRSARLSV